MTIASPTIQEQVRRSLAAQWLHARTTRDFAAVERLSLELLARYPQHAGIPRALARTLVALGRSEDALTHWQNLLRLNPRDIEAAHHLARPKSAASMPDDFRHIAICGVSFCGSTLMDNVLGSLPGCASIAESHWLTGARLSDGYAPIDFDVPDTGALHHCRACGRDCRVLSMEFRRGLGADATDWYARIARRLQTQILISADKNPPKLADHDPLLRFDALVMFKSPVQAWMSALRRLPQDRDAAFYLHKCETYLDLWTDRYLTLLDHFAPQGKIVFLYFDAFAQAPRQVLQGLCAALGLTFDAAALETAALCHAIGGNPNAVAKLRSAGGSMEIAALAGPDCSSDQLRLIADSAPVQEVFARLLSMSAALGVSTPKAVAHTPLPQVAHAPGQSSRSPPPACPAWPCRTAP